MLEGMREDEEPHILPEHRIRDAEGLLMPPKQVRLPMVRGGLAEEVARNQGCRGDRKSNSRRRGDGKGNSTRSTDVRVPDGDREVRSYEERNRAGDDDAHADLADEDVSEEVELPDLIEPPGIGQNRGCHERGDERQTDEKDEGGRTDTRTQEQRHV